MPDFRILPNGKIGKFDADGTYISPQGVVLEDTNTGASLQTVTPNLLASAGTFFNPTIEIDDIVSPTLLASSGSFFNPTISVGTVTVITGVLLSGSVIRNPIITGGEGGNSVGDTKQILFRVLYDPFDLDQIVY